MLNVWFKSFVLQQKSEEETKHYKSAVLNIINTY